jgi:hypothetical protein
MDSLAVINRTNTHFLVDFPIALPVIDLSTTIKGKSDLEKAKRRREESSMEA